MAEWNDSIIDHPVTRIRRTAILFAEFRSVPCTRISSTVTQRWSVEIFDNDTQIGSWLIFMSGRYVLASSYSVQFKLAVSNLAKVLASVNPGSEIPVTEMARYRAIGINEYVECEMYEKKSDEQRSFRERSSFTITLTDAATCAAREIYLSQIWFNNRRPALSRKCRRSRNYRRMQWRNDEQIAREWYRPLP